MGQCDRCKWYKQDKTSMTDWNYRCRYKDGLSSGHPDDEYYNQDIERCIYQEDDNG